MQTYSTEGGFYRCPECDALGTGDSAPSCPAHGEPTEMQQIKREAFLAEAAVAGDTRAQEIAHEEEIELPATDGNTGDDEDQVVVRIEEAIEAAASAEEATEEADS